MHSLRKLLLIGSLALVACGKDEQQLEANASGASNPELSAREEAPRSDALSPLPGLAPERFDRELQAELQRLDPATDGWSTEVASDRILTNLKGFGKWLESGRQGPCPLSCASDFQGSVPDPAKVAVVYEKEDFTIRRGSIKEKVDASLWLDAWPSGAVQHFKVVQITALNDTDFNATILADRHQDRVQENLVFKTQWRFDGDAVALLDAELPFYEHAERAVDADALFADATGSVLGGDPKFQQQLVYGIDHWRDRLDWRFGMEVTGPHGLAVGDVNGDGWDDLYVCETGGLPNRLFLRQVDGTAREASAEAGLDFLEPTHSALFVDWDNDSDQDVAVAVGRHVFFYENDGQGNFRQKAAAQSNSIARSMAAADFDGDGDVDLYVCGYFDRSGDSVGLGRPLPYHDANNGVENHLLANLGNWKFQDVTDDVGLGANNRRFSYAAAWEDYDNDGDQDLYVANDFGRNNLYQNNNGRFTDIAAQAGVEDLSAGMSVSWADVNHDGRMDVYVGNMFSSAGNRIAYQRQYRPELGGENGINRAFRRHARGNTLFLNTDTGAFRDVTLASGVNMGRWAWSSLFADVNNDSHEDLLVANGMVTSLEDTDDL